MSGGPPKGRPRDEPRPDDTPGPPIVVARDTVDPYPRTDSRCQVCGASVQPAWQFCGECGALAGRPPVDDPAPVVAPDQVPACARCGEPLEPDSAFCGGCGAPVVAAATADHASGIAPVESPPAPATAAPTAHPGSGRRRRRSLITVVGLLVLTGAAVVITTVVLPGLRDSDQDQAAVLPTAQATAGSDTQDPTRKVTPRPSPATSTPETSPKLTPTPRLPEPSPVTIPAGFQSCGPTATGETVFGNEVTSCPFALNVADAWAQSAGSSLLSGVPSPVTGQTYDMRCSGADPVRCEGGNDAAVLIYP